MKRSALTAILIGTAALAVSGCTSIRGQNGFVGDGAITNSVLPGVDNQGSVERGLGRPTFVSQFGEPVWYYVSSTTGQPAFGTPRITNHSVIAIRFDDRGNVTSVDRTGMELVARIDPNGDTTPTLGRERGFLEDLFGNIGQVGGVGAPGGGGGPP